MVGTIERGRGSTSSTNHQGLEVNIRELFNRFPADREQDGSFGESRNRLELITEELVMEEMEEQQKKMEIDIQ